MTENWYPIARSDDLHLRHVFHGQLLGRELAVWRADDGTVNVWENRCLHRGVRLTIGRNEGRELVCQYHGWRYASGTAGCTYIPAHPADAPARTICNVTFPAVERYGLVWTTDTPVEDPDGAEPASVEALDGASLLGLRNLPMNVEPEVVAARLHELTFRPGPLIDPSGAGYLAPDQPEPTTVVVATGEGWVHLRSQEGGDHDDIVCFVQPVDSARTVVRPVALAAPPEPRRHAFLQHHARRLARLRDQLEAEAARRTLPEPMPPALQQVSLELSELPPPPGPGRAAELRVSVARRWEAGAGIAGFELVPIDGVLPTPQPGAHIDVHLPNGLVRQYSLVNGPGETDRYVIGVKLEPASEGGSVALHRDIRQGDVLAISAPRNNFALRRDAFATVLVAGGIGITPLLAMAQALHANALPFRLHYFVADRSQIAFADRLEALGDTVEVRVGLSPDETGAALAELFADPGQHHAAYICGPGPMLDAARRLAAAAGWPDTAVHFEYFKNPNEVDLSSTFEVELARSALTLPVPAGTSIIEVLRANGVAVPSSCEQGACGTCLTTVVAGEPDHQDVYLNQTERDAGDAMIICVSRARSPRLVLDV